MSEPTTIEVRRPHTVAIEPQEFTRAKIALIKQTLIPGGTDAELELFVEYARRTGLDPFTKQIYAIPVWDGKLQRTVYQFTVGIDGLRLVAARTGEYEGQLGPQWKAKGEPWTDIWEEDGVAPFAARVGVYRTGFREATFGTVRYADFVRIDRQGNAIGNWRTMPAHMLAIRAEGHALRKAFPRESAGLLVNYDDTGETKPQVLEPDAKATTPQLQKLAILAQELGWDDDRRRNEAGVGSFNELKRGRASELIEAWQALAEGAIEDGVIVEDAAAAPQEAPAGMAASDPEPAAAQEEPLAPIDEDPNRPRDRRFLAGPHKGEHFADAPLEYLQALVQSDPPQLSGEGFGIAQAWLAYRKEHGE